MQDKYAEALTALGGMAAIGGLIDIYLYRDRKRVEGLMITLWVKFADVNWKNFGRSEALNAVAFLDAVFGPRFFSWKRIAIAMAVTCLAVFVSPLGFNFTGMTAVAFFLATLGFLLGISIARAIATVVAHISPDGIRGFLFYTSLLGFHVLLFIFWSDFLYYLRIISSYMVTYVVTYVIKGPDPWGFLHRKDWLEWDWAEAIRFEPGWQFKALYRGKESILLQTALLDILSNGVRIGFALVFLSSFLFGSFVQPFVRDVWEGMIESRRPLFTSIFGGIGAIFAATKVFLT